jgi:maleate isomerase
MPELGDRLRSFIGDAGITVAAQVDLNLLDFEAVAAAPAEQVTAWAEAALRGTDADAVFLPGTNLPTLEMIAPAERRLGVPVLAANQVTMWAGLRAAGLTPPPAVHDQRLFRAAA